MNHNKHLLFMQVQKIIYLVNFFFHCIILRHALFIMLRVLIGILHVVSFRVLMKSNVNVP